MLSNTSLRRPAFLAALLACICASAAIPGLKFTDISLKRNGTNIEASAHIVLDSLRLKSNQQLYITGQLLSTTDTLVLPSLLVNGRSMHIAWQRGTLAGQPAMSQPLADVIKRQNGKPQTYQYTASVPFQKWMLGENLILVMAIDSCGCGIRKGTQTQTLQTLNLNPWRQMQVAYRTPQVTEPPVSVHEGRARVQFEVNRTELHPDLYRCRNGRFINNSAQLKTIGDSIRYALSDPNVEIAGLKITGFASPESPYEHNAYLALNRSKALVDYLADNFNIPLNAREYSAVPENWEEFRTMVDTTALLTPSQRADLIQLIDEPANSPAEFDAKETTLKTSPRFKKLYRDLILPEFFPKLRATKFEIKTRLKPLSDTDLAKVFETNPGMMSLDQMFRVALIQPQNSPQFINVMEKILRYFPTDQTAATNAAAAAVASNQFDNALQLLTRAGYNPEAENLRGIIAARQGDFETASQHFRNAGNLEQALQNAELLRIIK